MKNEDIYKKVMGHIPKKDFGVKGSFGWDDIESLMNEAYSLGYKEAINEACKEIQKNYQPKR